MIVTVRNALGGKNYVSSRGGNRGRHVKLIGPPTPKKWRTRLIWKTEITSFFITKTIKPRDETQNRFCKRTLRSDNLFQGDDIGVSESLENFHLAKSRDREPIFFLFGVDPFQSDDFTSLLVLCNEDATVCSFTDLMLLFEYINVPHDNRCSN